MKGRIPVASVAGGFLTWRVSGRTRGSTQEKSRIAVDSVASVSLSQGLSRSIPASTQERGPLSAGFVGRAFPTDLESASTIEQSMG